MTAQISERTGHLPGVAIAIMGCIVNGVGEMADADFGYVGGAPGKVGVPYMICSTMLLYVPCCGNKKDHI